ncbi:hypothetical protein Q760_18110 [Cellulomonas cellasea DSM 20118]|uniref:Uncharacterized protein n=1 Tax=Cellulomonas cellasea DSM 20118 TaxID=1408250 RepID=A0A0A0B790_9CELL|nr:hypothetical protein Q760_18110 [Cellulomonas cellasea DSM 20118]
MTPGRADLWTARDQGMGAALVLTSTEVRELVVTQA